MASTRAAARTLRAFHARPSPAFRPNTFARPARRSYADSASSATPANSGTSSALVGGLAGGALTFGAVYLWYSFSGAKTAVNSIHSTKKYFDNSVKKLQDAAPEPNEALQWLRDTTLAYSAVIPGAKGYVNSAFDDLDAVRNKHGEEVDKIVSQAYSEVKSAMKSGGVSLETASKIWEILEKRGKEVAALAGDAAEDIMNNHPELKNKVGGNIDQLKELGEKYGPDAKKQVDETWQQISSIMSKGLTVSTIPDIKKLVQEKMEQVQKLGEKAFEKGMEQAKPYLDKSPKIKELIENNKGALMSGNVGELWEKVKSGDSKQIEEFVNSAVEKGKDAGKGMGVDVDSYLKMIPGMDGMGEKLQQLQKVAQEHGKEAQDLLKSTVEEIQQILKKKAGEAEKIAEKAKKDGSK